jgi:single-strand DNA-binding protein
MNVWTFTARLGKDAEQRHTSGGDSIVSFNAAVSSGFGQNKSTTWVNCSLWGKRGESLLPYLKKGQEVCVSGEANNRKWADKEGNDRFSLEVRVNDVTLIGGKQDGDSKPESQTAAADDSFDDSIPF